MTNIQRLVQRFLVLPLRQQISVVNKLMIYDEQYLIMSDERLWSEVFRRAEEAGLAEKLWTEVERLSTARQ